uniref:Uncharacterized protein n=1 Tax=Solanum lycopersicum TaxID=4081 RepID=A0A494G9L6_SOLLC
MKLALRLFRHFRRPRPPLQVMQYPLL